jgi:hypothetical protein
MPELGKKVFFLYPPSVVTEELVWEVVKNEYEVYLLKDHKGLKQLLPKYNDAIVFINIDAGRPEEKWEEYVREIAADPRTKDVRIGVLTYNKNEELARKYLMDLGVQAGFVTLSLGLEESSGIVLRMLEANEARGRRRYVRAQVLDRGVASFNATINGTMQTGFVRDISSVGMACYFEPDTAVPVRTYLRDLQLRLRGQAVTVSGVVSGSRRMEDHTAYVIMFDPRQGDAFRTKVRRFVHRQLTREINKELKTPSS